MVARFGPKVARRGGFGHDDPTRRAQLLPTPGAGFGFPGSGVVRSGAHGAAGGTMNTRLPLKQALAEGRATLGSWITLGHPAIAEIMCRAGFDWLTIDLEHSVITHAQAEQLIRVISLSGVTPLVRLTGQDPLQIKRMMDAGSMGVIAPQVNTAEQAKAVVEAVYYPPRGTRGVGLARAQGYGSAFADYLEKLERDAVVIVQIEHIQAVENIDSILSVPGVDGFILGPYDLSASLGLPGQFDHPKVRAALETLRQAMGRHAKAPGVHVVEPDLEAAKARLAEGYRFVAYSLDIRFLDTACRQGVQTLTPCLG